MAEPKRAARGGWETWVSAGSRDRRVRVHVRGRTKTETGRAADKVRRELASGSLPSEGRVKLDDWLASWISAREMAGKVRPKTLTGYRTDAKWIARTIGDVRLCDLTAEHVESLYGSMRRAGLSGGSVLHVRRTVRAALQTAVDRGRISRNPVALAEAPSDNPPEVEPLRAEEVQAVLTSAASSRTGPRWVLALVTGSGRARCSASSGTTSRGRPARFESDERSVAGHGATPAPMSNCPADRPHRCPHRVGGGLVAGPLKTTAARRVVVVPAQMIELLRSHRRAQAAERLRAGELSDAATGRRLGVRDGDRHSGRPAQRSASLDQVPQGRPDRP